MLVGRDFLNALMQCNTAFEYTPFFCYIYELPFLLHCIYYMTISTDIHTRVADLMKTSCIGGKKKLPSGAQSAYDQLVQNERKFCESMPAAFGQTFSSMAQHSGYIIRQLYDDYPKQLGIFQLHPPEASASRVAPIREVAGKLRELINNNWMMAIKVAQGLHYAQTCQRISELDDNSKQSTFFLSACYNSQIKLLTNIKPVANASESGAATAAPPPCMSLAPIPLFFLWPLLKHAFDTCLRNRESPVLPHTSSLLTKSTREVVCVLIDMINANSCQSYLIGRVWPPEILQYKTANIYPAYDKEDTANYDLLGPMLVREFKAFSSASLDGITSVYDTLIEKSEACTNLDATRRATFLFPEKREMLKGLFALPTLAFRYDTEVNATFECAEAYVDMINRATERDAAIAAAAATANNTLTTTMAQVSTLSSSSHLSDAGNSNSSQQVSSLLDSSMQPSDSNHQSLNDLLHQEVTETSLPVPLANHDTSSSKQQAPENSTASALVAAGISEIAYANATSRLAMALELVNKFHARANMQPWVLKQKIAAVPATARPKKPKDIAATTATAAATTTTSTKVTSKSQPKSSGEPSATKKRKREDVTKESPKKKTAAAADTADGTTDKAKPKKPAKKRVKKSESDSPDTANEIPHTAL